MASNPVFRNRTILRTFFGAGLVCNLSVLAWAADSAPQTREALTVSITAPAYWCPYACKADGSQWGFALEIARSALASAGHHVVYQNLPYDRALVETAQGNVDAVAPTFRVEAADFIFPAHALSTTEFCFYVADHEPWRYTGTESLKNMNLLVTSGYRYGETMDAYIADNLESAVTLLRGENIPDRLRRLVRLGRYDVFLDDRLLLEASGNSTGLANAGCLQERHAGYLALSPAHPERSEAIATAFDRGFRKIRENGRLCDILENYELSADVVPGLGQKECSTDTQRHSLDQ